MKSNRYLVLIGKQIAKIRKARGETQQQFAEAFNKKAPRDLTVSRVLVSKYERVDNATIPADKYLKFLELNPPGNPL